MSDHGNITHEVVVYQKLKNVSCPKQRKHVKQNLSLTITLVNLVGLLLSLKNRAAVP